eukprot:scaffold83865_cov87-Phaeocystis_antarctica.AAC.1
MVSRRGSAAIDESINMLNGLGRHENGAAQLEESMSVTPLEVATRDKPARLVARREQKAKVPGDSGWCAATCERRLTVGSAQGAESEGAGGQWVVRGHLRTKARDVHGRKRLQIG